MTAAYMPCEECVKMIKKETSNSTEARISTDVFHLNPSLTVFENRDEMDQDLQGGLLLVFLVNVYGIGEDMDQQLRTRPLLAFSSVGNQ